jgi:hypothetical protein
MKSSNGGPTDGSDNQVPAINKVLAMEVKQLGSDNKVPAIIEALAMEDWQ